MSSPARKALGAATAPSLAWLLSPTLLHPTPAQGRICHPHIVPSSPFSRATYLPSF